VGWRGVAAPGTEPLEEGRVGIGEHQFLVDFIQNLEKTNGEHRLTVFDIWKPVLAVLRELTGALVGYVIAIVGRFYKQPNESLAMLAGTVERSQMCTRNRDSSLVRVSSKNERVDAPLGIVLH
jgi:hypothetical protein